MQNLRNWHKSTNVRAILAKSKEKISISVRRKESVIVSWLKVKNLIKIKMPNFKIGRFKAHSQWLSSQNVLLLQRTDPANWIECACWQKKNRHCNWNCNSINLQSTCRKRKVNKCANCLKTRVPVHYFLSYLRLTGIVLLVLLTVISVLMVIKNAIRLITMT